MKDSFSVHIKVVESTRSQLHILEDIATAITDALYNGSKLFLVGNGGSAADAQHIAAEFIGRFKLDRDGLPAIALTTDTSVLTAISNDMEYKRIFSRQIEALADVHDIIWALSVSGRSSNIIAALISAKDMGCFRIGFTGKYGVPMDALCNLCFMVPNGDSDRVQEVHQLAYHCVIESIEKRLQTRE